MKVKRSPNTKDDCRIEATSMLGDPTVLLRTSKTDPNEVGPRSIDALHNKRVLFWA
jgi:hypothetical protein